jgi:protein-L-isoaspartate O-methyltransferase
VLHHFFFGFFFLRRKENKHQAETNRQFDLAAMECRETLFIAPFVATPLPVVKQMLTLAQIRPDEILYDLGCGDGRVVIMAAQEFGARSVGVEMREDLAKQALVKISELGLDGRVKVVLGDMFKVDLSLADVVTLYLTTSANDKVKPKLEAELKPGARVVSHDYEILGWRPVKVDNFCENPRLGYPSHTIYVYRKQ